MLIRNLYFFLQSAYTFYCISIINPCCTRINLTLWLTLLIVFVIRYGQFRKISQRRKIMQTVFGIVKVQTDALLNRRSTVLCNHSDFVVECKLKHDLTIETPGRIGNFNAHISKSLNARRVYVDDLEYKKDNVLNNYKKLCLLINVKSWQSCSMNSSMTR